MSSANDVAYQEPYRDRTVGLVIFGILQFLFGLLCALIMLLTVLSTLAMRGMGGPAGASMNARMMLPALLLYGLAAAWFITMGVGSMLARRWARALVLVTSWIWLVVGLGGIVVLLVMMPAIFDQMQEVGQMPPAAAVAMKVFMVGFFLLFYIIIPGVLVLFYGSRHVKATCDYKDPKTRWTDRCPLPVLAVSVILCVWALGMPMMGGYGWIFPLFGYLMTGPPGAVLCLLMAVAFAITAWGAYRLDMRAWWGAAVLIVAWTLSWAITFTQVNLMDLYVQMGFPEEQLKMMEQMMGSQMPAMMWFGLIWVCGFLAYLVYIRKYFVEAAK